jgi:hypothetical protein
MKEALELCKVNVESGKLKEYGETCASLKCTEVKDCYEKIFEPIPKLSAKGGKMKSDSGCCTIF